LGKASNESSALSKSLSVIPSDLSSFLVEATDAELLSASDALLYELTTGV
jgi:hypothetical protein